MIWLERAPISLFHTQLGVQPLVHPRESVLRPRLATIFRTLIFRNTTTGAWLILDFVWRCESKNIASGRFFCRRRNIASSNKTRWVIHTIFILHIVLQWLNISYTTQRKFYLCYHIECSIVHYMRLLTVLINYANKTGWHVDATNAATSNIPIS